MASILTERGAAWLRMSAAPDGYTVLAASQNALVMGRFLSKTNTLDVFEEGLELVGNSPAQFTAELRKQTQLIGRIAKAIHIQRTAH